MQLENTATVHTPQVLSTSLAPSLLRSRSTLSHLPTSLTDQSQKSESKYIQPTVHIVTWWEEMGNKNREVYNQWSYVWTCSSYSTCMKLAWNWHETGMRTVLMMCARHDVQFKTVIAKYCGESLRKRYFFNCCTHACLHGIRNCTKTGYTLLKKYSFERGRTFEKLTIQSSLCHHPSRREWWPFC